jgi:hypothetical protein
MDCIIQHNGNSRILHRAKHLLSETDNATQRCRAMVSRINQSEWSCDFLICILVMYELIKANILTGLVNLSIDTLEVSNLVAFCILSVYIFIINGVAGILRWKGWTLKF